MCVVGVGLAGFGWWVSMKKEEETQGTGVRSTTKFDKRWIEIGIGRGVAGQD